MVKYKTAWLKEEEEIKAKVDTIRGNIWRGIKRGKTTKGYLFKKGEEYTLKDDEIKKEINIEGKKYWVTNYGNILNESNLTLDDIDCVALGDFNQQIFGNEYLINNLFR